MESQLENVSEGEGEGEAISETETETRTEGLDHEKNWIEAQGLLKQRLVTQDDFTWRLPTTRSDPEPHQLCKYVGGVDISFSKEDSSIACGTLVVLDLQSLQIVYSDFSVVKLQVPYIPGFLAFREAPVLLQLLTKMKNNGIPFYPQLLMVDGNGVLHPRGFGLASHLGVAANLPTIGIGKNLHHVDGLTQSGVRRLLEAKKDTAEDLVYLKGCSGRIWGGIDLGGLLSLSPSRIVKFGESASHSLKAMRSTQGSLKPIYVSIGHRISLDTAITIVRMTCKYRVPEPIRQADIRSRDYVKNHTGFAGTV